MGKLADEFTEEFVETTRELFEEMGQVIVEDIQDLVSIPVTRRRYKDKKMVYRSKPGKPPRKDSGKLQASFDYEVTVKRGVVDLEVFSTDPKINWLEEGTSKMAARPSLAPTYEKWGPVINDSIVQGLE